MNKSSLKTIVFLILSFSVQDSIAQVVNKSESSLGIQNKLSVSLEVKELNEDKVIGKDNFVYKKPKGKSIKLSLLAEGFHQQDLFIGNSVPLNLIVDELHAEPVKAFKSVVELESMDLSNLNAQMLQKKNSKDSLKTEITLLNQHIEIAQNTCIGISGDKKIMQVSKEQAYDPVFGSPSGSKGMLMDIFDECGFLVVNRRNNGNGDVLKNAEPDPIVTVEPKVLKFGFSIQSIKAAKGYVFMSPFSLVIQFHLKAIGSDKNIEFCVNGIAQNSNPKEVYYQAIQMASYLLTKDEIAVSWIRNQNAKMLDAKNNSITKLSRVFSPFPDQKSLIKQCMEGVVTIKTNDGSFGSGFFISKEGLIITNKHVIDEANKLYVYVGKDTSGIEATVLRYDNLSDLALIKILPGNYTCLEFELEGNPEIGDPVIAIGTPASLRLGQTVSRGIISGHRVLNHKKLLQTDVSINPGNSGGPLINETGKVIGVVVSKIAGGGYEGLGFAIPALEALARLQLKYN
jgi:S1-C subfamily serine protease